jgi:hypothetical protein
MKSLKALLLCTALLLAFACHAANAEDHTSGSALYSVDLSLPFKTYSMTAKDALWSESLVRRLKYTGQVTHFVRTSLPLKVDSRTIKGAVYQAVEKTDLFYVANSDVMLKIGTRWAYSPGVGGFSMHAQKSRNYLVCLSLNGAIAFVGSSSLVQKGVVTWKGYDALIMLEE